MRYFYCALLLGLTMGAQQYQVAPDSSVRKGSFYVDGIVYQYAANANYTVVAAVHSVISHKFLGLKVRVYNAGQHSVTIKPEDVLVEDAVAGRAVAAVTGDELAKRMRKPYNMARLEVGNGGNDDAGSGDAGHGNNQQFLELMRIMAARTSSPSVPAGETLLYTDTPGALSQGETAPHMAECDEICRLRMAEAQGADMLAQLQKQNSPEYVEHCSLRSNTIPPHASVGGILYFPLGKLTQESSQSAHIKRRRIVRVTVPVDGERFQFLLLVE
jgi:hypothetical protein